MTVKQENCSPIVRFRTMCTETLLDIILYMHPIIVYAWPSRLSCHGHGKCNAQQFLKATAMAWGGTRETPLASIPTWSADPPSARIAVRISNPAPSLRRSSTLLTNAAYAMDPIISRLSIAILDAILPLFLLRCPPPHQETRGSSWKQSTMAISRDPWTRNPDTLPTTNASSTLNVSPYELGLLKGLVGRRIPHIKYYVWNK